MRPMILLAVVLGLLSSGAQVVFAQEQGPAPVQAPMAQRVPREALFYAGWSGSETIKQTYAGSHAQALLAASNLQVLFERTLPALGDGLARKNEDARPWAKFATEISPILFRHPTAIAFGGVDWTNQPDPLPRILLVCDAGSEAAELRNKLAELFAMVRKVELSTLIDVHDGVVYLSLGWQKLDLVTTGENAASSLLQDPRFTTAMRGMLEKPATAMFVDVQGLMQFAGEAAQRDKGEQGAKDLNNFIDATGLRGLGSVGMVTGFADGMYVTQAFVETRGARTGLLALLEPEPLDETLLKNVPADAGFVAAGRFDASKLLQAARNAIMVAQPDNMAGFEQGLKFINRIVGADIENDLLNSLGTSWAAYTAPATSDTALGVVAINRPSQPQRVDSALKNLSLSLASLANEETRRKGQPFRLSMREVQTPQGLIYFIDLPLLAPAWSTSEELVYFGLYPQTVAGAKALVPESSFEETPAFESIKQLAGGKPIRGFTYVDLPRYSGPAYMRLSMFVQLDSGMLSSYGEAADIPARFPPMVLPPYATFRQHLTPAISVTWVDESGLHLRSAEAFPGSGLLGIGMQ